MCRFVLFFYTKSVAGQPRLSYFPSVSIAVKEEIHVAPLTNQDTTELH